MLCSIAGCALAPEGIDVGRPGPDLDSGELPDDAGGHDLWRPEAGVRDSGTDGGVTPARDADTPDAEDPDAAMSTNDAEPPSADDAGTEAIDAGEAAEAGAVEAGATDSGTGPGETAEAGKPVNCAPLATSSVQLCDSAANECGAVFTNSAGCTSVCAAAGLSCALAYENVDGQCAADKTRPELPCDSGHQSDYCVCRASN